MADALLSSCKLLERLGREEQQLKHLGLHAQAAGVRVAITVMLRVGQEHPEEPQPMEPSADLSDGA